MNKYAVLPNNQSLIYGCINGTQFKALAKLSKPKKN